MTGRRIAHFNWARLRWPADDPRVAGFLRGRDPIRRIAQDARGFVWKQETGAGESTIVSDPRLLLSLSVWENPEALRHFARRTLHRRFWQNRAEWFEAAEGPTFVMWWIAPDHRPDHAEAWSRLAHLRDNGDSAHAFGWAYLDATAGHGAPAPIAAE